MVTVAIAAGNGHVGGTIASVLKENPKHKVIILSRKPAESEDPKAPTYVVDYGNVEATAELLKSHSVHTVISAIFVVSPESGAAEINLVNAAVQSGSAKRFISSDWGLPRPKDDPQPFRQATVDALRKTDLEFTTFHGGYFLDYFGMPHIKSQLVPTVWNVDMEDCKAAIPGDGNAIAAYTYSFDVARFVEAALDLPKGEWQEATYCYGDKVSFNQIIKWAEEARGRKFEVSYDSIEKLKTGQMTELPGHLPTYEFIPKVPFQGLVSQFGWLIAEGFLDFPEERCINKKFPDIKTTTAKEVIDAWKGK
ncbi:NAD(P)-binding protein [Cryphonectria parasitica EP155]|uniref:NAD(P)-binding protein n=1 Tax=Cryphonectria parasitica (strain ATCC 38755 / EP155) TaxID=660469 RepID=A0A9P4XUT3_CRYP1|nr:NAD(P)-binding protein [Cryphonectria parasitica EP155]KAF3761010.1 NAD(P)-binding protein [Cryphonectria parasitica EP155]